MPIVLYHVNGSPPVRSVLMVAKALDVDLELKEVDFSKKEYLEPWFLELNPTHTVPTLDDNGFVLWDSHAIIRYLAEKYGKDDSLYPKDIQKRAIVDQILSLDCGTLFRRISEAVHPLFDDGEKSIPNSKLDNIKEVYTFLERILQKPPYLAGDTITLADLSTIATVSTCNVVLPVDSAEFPRFHSWMDKIKALPWFEAGVEGLNMFESAFQRPLFYDGEKSIPNSKLDNLKEAYTFLERILQRSPYLAGDTITLADLSAIASVTTSNVVVPVDSAEFPKLHSWMDKIIALPWFEAGVEGLKAFESGFKVMTNAS